MKAQQPYEYLIQNYFETRIGSVLWPDAYPWGRNIARDGHRFHRSNNVKEVEIWRELRPGTSQSHPVHIDIAFRIGESDIFMFELKRNRLLALGQCGYLLAARAMLPQAYCCMVSAARFSDLKSIIKLSPSFDNNVPAEQPLTKLIFGFVEITGISMLLINESAINNANKQKRPEILLWEPRNNANKKLSVLLTQHRDQFIWTEDACVKQDFSPPVLTDVK